MPFALMNKSKGHFVQVLGDGSECLVPTIAQATLFVDKYGADEAFAEHDKWVGPLEIVPVGIKVG